MRCSAYRCNTPVRRGQHLLCPWHWKKVPGPLQDAYKAERDAVYASGQDTTVELLQAMADCLTAVNGQGAS